MISMGRLKTGLVFDFYPIYKLASQLATVLRIASRVGKQGHCWMWHRSSHPQQACIYSPCSASHRYAICSDDAGHVKECGMWGKPCFLTNQSITTRVLCLEDSGEGKNATSSLGVRSCTSIPQKQTNKRSQQSSFGGWPKEDSQLLVKTLLMHYSDCAFCCWSILFEKSQASPTHGKEETLMMGGADHTSMFASSYAVYQQCFLLEIWDFWNLQEPSALGHMFCGGDI